MTDEGPLTKTEMAGFSASLDSAKWEVDAIIPVQAGGSNRVSVLADGRVTEHFKDGTIYKAKLFEHFIFENQVLVGVRQWSAALPEKSNQK